MSSTPEHRQVGTATGAASITQAGRDVNVTLGGRRGPGLSSVAVPVGRLDHEVHGRAELLDELSRAAVTGGRIVVLHAAGGYGKTTVAAAFAHRAQARAQVWWVDATSAESLSEGLREVAVQAGAPHERVRMAWAGEGSAVELLWSALEERADHWLLVLDNADDPRVLSAGNYGTVDGHGWLRVPRHGGTVLVTTRDGRRDVWGQRARMHRITALEDDAGAAALTELAPDSGDDADARALSRRLGGLPLALRLAGRYLLAASDIPPLPGSRQPRTFRDYAEALDTRFAELTTAPFPGVELGSRELISRTWELSLDLLADRGRPMARPLLRLLSTMAPAPVPVSLLDAGTLRGSPLFADVTPDQLGVLLAGLRSLGLVDYRHADPMAVTLHPLVRQANRLQADLRDDGGDYRAARLALLWHATAQLDWDHNDNWPLWSTLLPHCTGALDPDDDEQAVTVSRIRQRAADFCDEMGLCKEAERLYGEALETQSRLLGPEDSATLTTRGNLALALRNRGALAAAEAECRHVLAVRERVLGIEHKSTLTTRNNLAAVLRQRGDLDAAEREYRTIIEVRQRVFDEEDPGTLISRNNLAAVHRERGDHAAAEAEYRALLAILRRVKGDEHHHTLTIRNNLAAVLRDRGQASTAEAEYRELLSIQQRKFGPEHPHTLVTRQSLGTVLRARGDLVGAAHEYRQVLDARRRLLGDDHPDTVLAREHVDGIERERLQSAHSG